MSPLQELGISDPVRQTSQATEVLHEVLYHFLSPLPPIRTRGWGAPLLYSSPLNVIPSGLTEGVRKKRRTIFPILMPFPSFLCPPFLQGGVLLLLFFRFSVRVLASHRFTTGVVLLVLLYLLELGIRIGKSNGGQRKCRAKSLLPPFSFFLTKNCVNAVLSSHAECSHLILYQSYVTNTEFSSL